MNGPFDLHCEKEYINWREKKLEDYPRSANELIVEVSDPAHLTRAEHQAILDRCRRANMAIYASSRKDAEREIPKRLGAQFGLTNLDANWLADPDGISEITVRTEGRGYIPYTDKPIKWHTDGYYNPPSRTIRAMLLHCVEAANEGGENGLIDHEILYMLLRDENPEHIQALSNLDAMTIPERLDEQGVARPAQSGPVFSVENGKLHMRYTARTRSISWQDDIATKDAVSHLESILSSDQPLLFRTALKPGMGIICNNVLHDRSAFKNEGSARLLYRARYYDRISGT